MSLSDEFAGRARIHGVAWMQCALGSKLDSLDFLATLALSYDADVLVDSLLLPRGPKMDPGKVNGG